MRNALTIAIASALITTAAIKAAPALAQAQPVEPKVSLVRTADLDLRSAAGRRQLDLRLARAAREVCGVASDADLMGKNEVRECRERTLALARTDGVRLAEAVSRDRLIAVTANR